MTAVMFEKQLQRANDMIRRARLGVKEGFAAIPEVDYISFVEEDAWQEANRQLIIHSFGAQSDELARYERILQNRLQLYEKSRDRKDPYPIFVSFIEYVQQVIGLFDELEAKFEALQSQRNSERGITVNIRGNINNSIINVDSVLRDVCQTIGTADIRDQETKKQLMELIEQLKLELQKTPPERREAAEAIADSAKALVEAGTKSKPNKTTLQITAQGLKKAAECVADIMPTVLSVASSIVKSVSLLSGHPLA